MAELIATPRAMSASAFRRADEEVGTGIGQSPNTGGQRLTYLERRLGVELFTRTGRGPAPTAVGSAFLRRAARNPLARTREPIPVSTLGEIPLVLWPRESAPHAHDEIIALCHKAGVVPRIGARGRSAQTILALVAAGFGAAVMDDSYRVLHREGVIPRRLADAATTLHLVWRAEDEDPVLRGAARGRPPAPAGGCRA